MHKSSRHDVQACISGYPPYIPSSAMLGEASGSRHGSNLEGLRSGSSSSLKHSSTRSSSNPRPSSHRRSALPSSSPYAAYIPTNNSATPPATNISLSRQGSGSYQPPSNMRWGTHTSGAGSSTFSSYLPGTDSLLDKWDKQPSGKGTDGLYLRNLERLASGQASLAQDSPRHNTGSSGHLDEQLILHSRLNQHSSLSGSSGKGGLEPNHVGTVVLQPPVPSPMSSSGNGPSSAYRLGGQAQSIMATRNAIPPAMPHPSIIPRPKGPHPTPRPDEAPHPSSSSAYLSAANLAARTASEAAYSGPSFSRANHDPHASLSSLAAAGRTNSTPAAPTDQGILLPQATHVRAPHRTSIDTPSPVSSSHGPRLGASASVLSRQLATGAMASHQQDAASRTHAASGSFNHQQDKHRHPPSREPSGSFGREGFADAGSRLTLPVAHAGYHGSSGPSSPPHPSSMQPAALYGAGSSFDRKRGELSRISVSASSASSHNSDNSTTTHHQQPIRHNQQRHKAHHDALQQQQLQQQQQQQQQGYGSLGVWQPKLPTLQAAGLLNLPPRTGCVGLQNLGNTCFMNSILQLLNAVPELVAWAHLEANSGGTTRPSKAAVAPAYTHLVTSMWSSQNAVLSPQRFMQSMSRLDLRWGDSSQQDSQEFMHALLEALQAESNRAALKPQYRQLEGKGSEVEQAEEAWQYTRTWHDSVIDDIFGGMLQSTLRCNSCRRESHCFEPFIDLALPIPAPSKGHTTLEDCLAAFFAREELDGSESYKCEACKRHCHHSKAMQLWHPPPVLLLSLKRFSQKSGSTFFSRFRSTSKNNASVDLELEALDLSRFCNPVALKLFQHRGRRKGSPVYELIGMSHHSGSLEGGHYTASARSVADGKWYSFNDSIVKRQEARLEGSSAYVLVYRLVHQGSSGGSNNAASCL